VCVSVFVLQFNSSNLPNNLLTTVTKFWNKIPYLTRINKENSHCSYSIIRFPTGSDLEYFTHAHRETKTSMPQQALWKLRSHHTWTLNSGTVHLLRPQNTTVWTCASGERHRQIYRLEGGFQGQHIVHERRTPLSSVLMTHKRRHSSYPYGTCNAAHWETIFSSN
jgi:hypothetical protein